MSDVSEHSSLLARVDRVLSQKILYGITRVMAVGGACTVIALMMIATVSVFGRRIPAFQGPWLAFCIEYSEFLMALTIGFTVCYTWYKSGHVRIGIIFDSLSPRAKDVINLISTLIGLVIIGYICYSMWPTAYLYFKLKRTTSTMVILEYPWLMVFCFSMTIFTLALLRSAIGFAIKLTGRPVEHGGLY